MNLYIVDEKDSDYATYVFAETRNKARVMMIGFYWDEEYINLRARLVAKDVGGIAEVVDNDEGEVYERLLKLGGRYESEVE